MTYVVLPNSGQTLGSTRAQINTNFSLIQSVFDNNHYDFNAAPNSGKHSVIQLPEQTTFPLTPVDEGQLLARAYNSKTELAWRPENTLATGDQYILSGMPIRAAARFVATGGTGIKTPTGLFFNINTITKSTATQFDILFLTQFPIGSASANYMIIATTSASATNIGYSNVSQTGFSLTVSTAGFIGDINFLVLGG